MSLYLLAACSTGVSLMVVNSAVDCVDTASDTCRGWKVIVTACTTETHDIFSLYLIGGLPSFFLSSLVSVVPPPFSLLLLLLLRLLLWRCTCPLFRRQMFPSADQDSGKSKIYVYVLGV